MRIKKEMIEKVLNYLKRKGINFGLGTSDGEVMVPMSIVEILLYLENFEEWQRQNMELTISEYSLWKEDPNRCMGTTEKRERCKELVFPYCRIHSYSDSQISGKTAQKVADELGISKCSLLAWAWKLNVHKRNNRGWYVFEENDLEKIRQARKKSPHLRARLDNLIHEALI